MVDMKDLYPGCRVKIVDHWVFGCHQNADGLMDPWLGQVMTVDYIGISGTGRPCVYMKEDMGVGSELQGYRWCWFPAAIAEILSDFPDVDDLI